MNKDRIILLSFAISGVSFFVALGAVFVAVSREFGSPQAPKVTIPEPKALTADNPASKLPHAGGMRPVVGIVLPAA